MTTQTLSLAAQQVISDYLHLPFEGKDISCPYYNNRRNLAHGALRVLVGKGSVSDIIEEATIISLREKIELTLLSNETLKKFLIQNNIGIDCSALAYYILEAETKASGRGPLKKYLHYPEVINPLRKLLIRLRRVENTNVCVLAHKKNSLEIPLSDIKPGDIIIMKKYGEHHDRDHVLTIHEVAYVNEKPTEIHYTHALQWRIDGQFNHGVRQGKIIVEDIKKPLLEERWIENEVEGSENETLQHAQSAAVLEVRRLKALA